MGNTDHDWLRRHGFQHAPGGWAKGKLRAQRTLDGWRGSYEGFFADADSAEGAVTLALSRMWEESLDQATRFAREAREAGNLADELASVARELASEQQEIVWLIENNFALRGDLWQNENLHAVETPLGWRGGYCGVTVDAPTPMHAVLGALRAAHEAYSHDCDAAREEMRAASDLYKRLAGGPL